MVYAKFFGWILIIAGVAIIAWTLVSSYNIFTAKAPVPQLFYLPIEVANNRSTDSQAQLENLVSEQLRKLIPSDTVTKTLNLAAWSILAFILIFGATQISGIGIRLLNKEG